MLLDHKTAVVYGGGGAIGGAVARSFAREGAAVFLAGRSRSALDEVAVDILGTGGTADLAELDATDAAAVDRHLAAVVAERGGVDISFNAVGIEDVQGTPLVEMAIEDFETPIRLAMRTQFVTMTATGRHMASRGSGVILAITATPARMYIPNAGGFAPACAAVEGLCRQLAGELGPAGVRVVCLRSAGSPDAIEMGPLESTYADLTLLKRLPMLEEVGKVAALMASDYASPMTGTVANLTCGSIVD